jgi:hypothetical protein
MNPATAFYLSFGINREATVIWQEDDRYTQALASDSQIPVFLKAVIASGSKDYMIQYADSQNLASLTKGICHCPVLAAGVYVAAGMVMRNYYRCSSIFQGIGKNFPRVNQRTIHQTNGADPYGIYLVGAIEGDHNEMLLLPVGIML